MSAPIAVSSMGREPATVRVAMWSARHRWPVAALWFVITIGIFVISQSVGGIKALDANTDPNERQLEASEAYELFNAGGTNDPYEQVIVVIGGLLGDWNWWMPRWLDWIPRVTIEGEPDEPAPGTEEGVERGAGAPA